MKKFQGRGFAIGAVLLAIVLLAVVAGAIALGSRGSSSNAGDSTARVNAATIVQQSSNLRQGFDIMMARGTSINTITMNTDATTGLFHPTVGGTQAQTVPAAAQSVASDWMLSIVRIKGVGTDAGEDHAVIVVGLKDAVCRQINQTLTNRADVPTSGLSEKEWAVGKVDLSGGLDGVDGRSELCVGTSDGSDHNAYYSVVAAQ